MEHESPIATQLVALQTMVGTLSNFCSTATTKIIPSRLMRNGTVGLNDSELIAKWVKAEEYVNLTRVSLATPVGLSTAYTDYITDLKSVWAILGDMDTELLKPLDRELAAYINKPATLMIPNRGKSKIAPRFTDATVLQDTKTMLARNFDNKFDESKPLGKLFKSGNDIESAYKEIKILTEATDEVSSKDLTKLVASISEATEDLSLEKDIHPKTREYLRDTVEMAAKWIELFGVTMLQINSCSNAMNISAEKLANLAKK